MDNKTAAEHLRDTWDPAVLKHCARDLFDVLKSAIEAEFRNRQIEFLFWNSNSFFVFICFEFIYVNT